MKSNLNKVSDALLAQLEALQSTPSSKAEGLLQTSKAVAEIAKQVIAAERAKTEQFREAVRAGVKAELAKHIVYREDMEAHPKVYELPEESDDTD